MFLRQLRRSCITASVNIESWNYHYLRSTRFLSPLSLALPQLPLYFTRFSTLAEGRVRHQKHSGVQLDTSEHEDILKLTGRIEVSPSQHQPENQPPQQIKSLTLPLCRGSEAQSFQVGHLHQIPYILLFTCKLGAITLENVNSMIISALNLSTKFVWTWLDAKFPYILFSLRASFKLEWRWWPRITTRQARSICSNCYSRV